MAKYYTKETVEDVKNRFADHPLIDFQICRHKLLRRFCLSAASNMVYYCPPSRERDLAIMKIEEALMWANAAIALNEHPAEAEATEATEAEAGILMDPSEPPNPEPQPDSTVGTIVTPRVLDEPSTAKGE